MTQVYELTGSKGGITVEVTLEETWDLEQNSSVLSVGLRVKSSAYYNYIYYLKGGVTVDGVGLVTMNSAVPTHYAKPTALNSYASVKGWSSDDTGSPWTGAPIVHNTDGSKSVTVEVSLKGYTSGGGGTGWSVADSRTVELTHIPRASAIGATDACIGSVSAVSVVRRSQSYTHTVEYAFGALRGYLDGAGNHSDTPVALTQSSIPFTLPEAFYYQIPDAPRGSCVLSCVTYRDTEQIGDVQSCSFTVTADPALCAPSVTAAVEDTNPVTLALTGDKDVLVRFHSAALCAMTAEAKYGASILSRSIAGEETDGERTMEQVQTGSFLFTVTDSRGYSASCTVEKTLLPYIHLSVNPQIRRTDPTSGDAALTAQGSCYSGAFGSGDNTLAVSCAVNGGEAIALTPLQEGDSYTLSQTLTELDYRASHTVTVTAWDALETVSRTVSVGKGIPVFDWGEEDFCFHVPVALPGLTVNGQSLQDYIRAVVEGG